MDPQPLNIRVDSKQAQADLAALARALDTAGNSASNFKSKFSAGMAGADTAVKSATHAMGQFAQVAALVSKIKISNDPANQLKLLTSAMSQLGKMGGNIKGATTAMGQFAEVAHLIDRIKLNPANVKNLADFSMAIAQVSKTRGPSSNSLKGLVNFIEVAARAQNLKFNPAMAANMRAFAAAMDSIGRARIITSNRVQSLKELFSVLSNLKAPNGAQKLQALFATIASIKVPSEKAIQRIEKLFTVLANAKAIPGAAKIAHDLDTIAAAAARAGTALNSMPKTIKGISPAFQQASNGASKLHNNLKETPGHVQKAHGALGMLGKGLGDLGGRFSLAYQASTLFSQFFAAFTVGEFLHKLYDANIQLLKLQKALVFSTGSFAGAERATDTYIGIANDLGLSLGKTTEAYSKFTLAAKSSGIDLSHSNDIYKAFGTALQVVGASSQQTELAFYGLQQMIQKGKVSAEEFNRQIGEQIPGNAVLGARALSKLEGHVVSVGEFFQQMSKGQILSAQFVPAYAEEVRKQFEPLVKLAQERPDAALNRLTNSFFVFARAVGKGGVMTALTHEFDRLSAKIMYTDDAGTHLTPQFQKLADSIGHGLTSSVHLLGDGLAFLTDHLDEVMTTLKLMLALRVGATFSDWGKGAFGLASNLTGLLGGKGVSKAVTATAAAAAIAPAASSAASIGQLAAGQATRSIIGRRSLGAFRTTTAKPGFLDRARGFFSPAATTDVRATSRLVGLGMPLAEDAIEAAPILRPATAARATFGLRTAATAEKSGGIMGALGGLLGFGGGAKVAAKGVEEAAVGAEKAVGIFSKFGGVIGRVAPLLGLGLVGALAAGGIALAVFGDNTTKVQGKTMKFNDIVLGGFDVLKKGFGDWWDKSKPNFKFFTDAMDGLGKNSGEIVASIVAGFVTLGKVLGRVFSTIGTIIGEFIQHSPLSTFVQIMAKVATGDFKGAGSILKESFNSGFGTIPIAKAVGGLVTGTIDDVKSFGDTRQQVIDAGAKIAADRDQKVAADAAVDAQHALIESTLAQAQAADAAAEKMGELQNINRQIALGNLGTPTPQELLKQASDAAAAPSVTPTAAMNATAGGVSADATKGASQAVQDAINAAAAKYGVSADYLFRTAKRESNFNTNAKAGTSSAGGLFQFTDGTAKAFGLANRFDANQSADAAARLTAQNSKYLEGKTGHTATGAELYAAHFLGAGSAAKLISASMTNPMATGAEMFPDAAKANHNIFYGKDGKAKTAVAIMSSINDTYAGGAGAGAAGGGAGGAGAAAGAVTEGTEQTLTTKFRNASETYNGLISRNASPSVAAQASYDKYLQDTKELLDLQDQLHKKGVNTFVDTTKLADAMAQADKELRQAINPFLKYNEEVDNNNKLLELRAAGLTDQADFQEKLNGYIAQGYKATELDNQANRDAVQAGKDRADVLQSQIDLTSTLNDLQGQRRQRYGSPLDVAIAGHIKPEEGESYDHALAAAKDNPEQFANIKKAAQAEVSQQQDFAKDDLRVNMSEMQSTARLSASARGYRDDFKGYLQELTGISTGTLDELTKRADPSLVALAKHAADVKYALDNAPGFQRWADQIEPLAKKLNDLKGDFAEGLSDNLASALNGDKVDWSSFLHDFRKQIIKAQVQDVMKGLFGGKLGDAMASPDEKIKSAADATSMAASTTTQAATGLSTSATDLSSAAQSLTSAAQAISQACAGTMSGDSSAASLAGGAGSDAFTPYSSLLSGAAADPVGASLDTSLPSLLSAAGSGRGTVGQNDPDPTVTIMGKRPPLTMYPKMGDILTGAAADPVGASLDTSLPSIPQLTGANGGGDGILGSIGNFITQPQSGLMGLAKNAGLAGLLGLLAHKKKKKKTVTPHDINGVIGESRDVTMSGKEIAAHSNPIADVLNFGISMAGAGGFGAPGGNLTSALGFGKGAAAGASAMSAASKAGTNNMGGWMKRMFAGMFSEGGIATMPVAGAATSMASFAGAPHYKEGTPNTSGIPAFLHPEEAVVPLTRGRAIPIEGDLGGSTNHFTTNMTIVTPDANSFRKSRSSIERDQGRAQRRASLRNLN